MFTHLSQAHFSAPQDVTKPKEKRRKHQKTKTGCKTCRVRRVKCDETKPQCLRCIKLGVECVSIFSVPKAKEPISSCRALAPKQQNLLALPLELVHGIRFKDIRESRYFRYYCEDIAAQIRGPVKTSMWEQLIPQTGEMLPFVRDSLVSLGAFTKARSCLEESESTLHLQYGLKQYSKALNGMREHLSGTKWDYRTALFSCVLVTCCEIIQGNQSSAALHASSGENLIYEEAMRDRDHNRSPLECSRRMKLEEDLCRAFLELDLHTLTFLDRRTTAQHNRREGDLTQGISYMPREFDDIEQCYMFWQLIVARNLHFIARARKSALEESNGSKTTTDETCIWDSETCSWLSIVKLKSKDVLQTRDECLHDLIRWGQALSALIEHHPSIASKLENHTFISLMKMHSAMNQIRVGSISFVEEIEYDMFLDLFTEIIDLTPHVVPYMKKGGAFYHFGVGFILPLNTVAMHCRHRILRNQAIDLLKSSEGYREGVGDAYSAGLANEWQRDLEEPWADDEGWVSGDRRVMITGANSNINERWAHITGMQRTGTMEGKGMKVEKLITW